jgi:hypothetical protein
MIYLRIKFQMPNCTGSLVIAITPINKYGCIRHGGVHSTKLHIFPESVISHVTLGSNIKCRYRCSTESRHAAISNCWGGLKWRTFRTKFYKDRSIVQTLKAETHTSWRANKPTFFFSEEQYVKKSFLNLSFNAKLFTIF